MCLSANFCKLSYLFVCVLLQIILFVCLRTFANYLFCMSAYFCRLSYLFVCLLLQIISFVCLRTIADHLICLSAHLSTVADKLDISKIMVVEQVGAEGHQVGGVVPPHQVEHLSGPHCLSCLYLKK